MDRHRRRKRAAPCFFFFCFVTSLSLFWVRKSLPPFLYSKRHVFRCSAYAARHRDRLTLTTAAACQVPRRRRTRSQGKKKTHVHSSVTRSHFQFCRTGRSHASTPGAGISPPAARPAGPDFDVARKRKRPRPFILLSLPPLLSKFPRR